MSEYYAGMDCECMARGESECGCAADWTPKEVYKLRKKVAELELALSNERLLQTKAVRGRVDTERNLSDFKKRVKMGIYE